VVVPLAAGERRRAGRLVECFLLVALLPGARDLRRVWSDPALPARARRGLARALGVLVQQAHAAGLDQDDLVPNNVLVCDETQGVCLIDFERARLRRRTALRARRCSLAKLARAATGVPASQRLRFLCAYAGDSGAARLWWDRCVAWRRATDGASSGSEAAAGGATPGAESIRCPCWRGSVPRPPAACASKSMLRPGAWSTRGFQRGARRVCGRAPTPSPRAGSRPPRSPC
jgi:hypothetical protein